MNKILSILCLIIAIVTTITLAYYFQFSDLITFLIGTLCGFIGMSYAKIFWEKN